MATFEQVRADPHRGYLFGAAVTQLASYATTLSLVAYLMKPTTNTAWAITTCIALLGEILLIVFKEMLFSDGGDGIGWFGFIVDGIINAGGVLPWAPALLTYAPIAAMLSLVGLDPKEKAFQAVVGFIFSVAVGGVLSVAPHRLWRRAWLKKGKE